MLGMYSIEQKDTKKCIKNKKLMHIQKKIVVINISASWKSCDFFYMLTNINNLCVIVYYIWLVNMNLPKASFELNLVLTC